MTDHTTALDFAKQAFRTADHAYDLAVIALGDATRAVNEADYVLRHTAYARKAAAMKVRHAAADAAKNAAAVAAVAAVVKSIESQKAAK